MKIQVANGKHPNKRLWLELPITNDPDWIRTTGKLAVLAAPEQTDVTLRIKDVESPVPNLKKYIMADSSQINISRMNLLAEKTAVMSELELQKFSGALDIESIGSIEDIQGIADSLDDYELLPGVTDERGLGFYLVEQGRVKIPESALRYVDYSIVGAEYMSNNSCAYTDGGLVVRKDDAGQSRTVIFDLRVTSPFNNCRGNPPIRLTLPAAEEKLGAVAERLGLFGNDISGGIITESKCPIAYLDELLPNEPDIGTLNSLAEEIAKLSQNDGQLIKLCAVLEAERPDAIGRALEVTRNLGDYRRLNGSITNAADYGYHVLYESDLEAQGIEFQEEVKDFIDFQKYGEWRMEEDSVRQTDFGMVRRISEPFELESGMGMRME